MSVFDCLLGRLWFTSRTSLLSRLYLTLLARLALDVYNRREKKGGEKGNSRKVLANVNSFGEHGHDQALNEETSTLESLPNPVNPRFQAESLPQSGFLLEFTKSEQLVKK